MTDAELLKVIELGKAMRDAQKKYYKERYQWHLEAAKKLEKEFDKAAAIALGNTPAITLEVCMFCQAAADPENTSVTVCPFHGATKA